MRQYSTSSQIHTEEQDIIDWILYKNISVLNCYLYVLALDGGCVDSFGRICGCLNPSNTTHSIECCGDKIIQLEFTGETIIYQRTDSTCKPSNVTVPCVTSDNRNSLDLGNKVNIYNNCSGQKQCDVHLQASIDIMIQTPVTCEPGSGSKVDVFCNGNQKDVTEKPSPSYEENCMLVCKEGDEIKLYIMFGSILAAVIVINIVCIGVYCCIRNRKTPKETTTNVAMSNRGENDYDNPHHNYLHVIDDPVADYEQLPT
ncbi:hypothetical protein LOTGIDRAFT_175447 [Lottia gigantea]|uniref:Uncharacterized protein n=1 Tax=Lottia gigantea TaxID=225164 RepID=V3ZSI3_LOTGI|nr:hypothetical protein LOTGIDRAFT_175447 [Lottia gigantea]ESO94393.1 hypothetical protein LOTGIDRAFT_175447 [Lottia gigantea]